MPRLNVNPTRMEQQKQKARLKTAARGHKLLKDKSDEMIRRFMGLIKKNQALREQIEKELTEALELFMEARTQMPAEAIEAAVSNAQVTRQFTTSTTNIMGLVVPKLTLAKSPKATEGGEDNPPLSITTPDSFDRSVRLLTNLLAKIIELANVEKTCDMLAAEIEKNRRRINALEHLMMPSIRETVRYITMKLSENERGNQVRLMKVKEMLENDEEGK